MYSMVLMAAMLPSGDAAGFGKRSNGCNGGCTGTVVVASSGCHGDASGCCGGGHSCHGGGFLGLRDRSNNCCGGGGFLGLRGKHKSHGCSGYVPAGCSGYVPAGCSGGCSGTPVAPPAPAPEPLPKS